MGSFKDTQASFVLSEEILPSYLLVQKYKTCLCRRWLSLSVAYLLNNRIVTTTRTTGFSCNRRKLTTRTMRLEGYGCLRIPLLPFVSSFLQLIGGARIQWKLRILSLLTWESKTPCRGPLFGCLSLQNSIDRMRWYLLCSIWCVMATGWITYLYSAYLFWVPYYNCGTSKHRTSSNIQFIPDSLFIGWILVIQSYEPISRDCVFRKGCLFGCSMIIINYMYF